MTWVAVAWGGAAIGAILVGGAILSQSNISGSTTTNEVQTKITQQSIYGAGIPRLYGRIKLGGNIFWLRKNKIDIRSTYIENEGGGKGGGGDPGGQIVQEAYGTFAIGLGIGPAYAVGRIWGAKQLIYNITRDTTARIDADGVFHGSGAVSGKKFTFALFPGTINQPPSGSIQMDLGAANTPRYPKLVYVLMNEFPLESFGNTLQATNFEFELIKLPQEYEPEGPV